MDKKTVAETIYCLPKEKTHFHYFKDRYALMLLSLAAGDGKSVAELKKSRYGNLLAKPLVKKVLSGLGSGRLSSSLLAAFRPNEQVLPFILTVDSWGGEKQSDDQTSRRGHNLVLQLNFTEEHEADYHRLVKPLGENVLNDKDHPVFKPGKRPYFNHTLAWARIDFDFDYNEALIEEVQSDWVEVALMAVDCVNKCDSEDRKKCDMEMDGEPLDVLHYAKHTLKPYSAIWDEAMLSATIDFIYRELGIRNIYYHEFETGGRLKKIKGDQPPRSIYSNLPKRFCFARTDSAPNFLMGSKEFRHNLKKVKSPEWYKMQL